MRGTASSAKPSRPAAASARIALPVGQRRQEADQHRVRAAAGRSPPRSAARPSRPPRAPDGGGVVDRWRPPPRTARPGSSLRHRRRARPTTSSAGAGAAFARPQAPARRDARPRRSPSGLRSSCGRERIGRAPDAGQRPDAASGEPDRSGASAVATADRRALARSGMAAATPRRVPALARVTARPAMRRARSGERRIGSGLPPAPSPPRR